MIKEYIDYEMSISASLEKYPQLSKVIDIIGEHGHKFDLEEINKVTGLSLTKESQVRSKDINLYLNKIIHN